MIGNVAEPLPQCKHPQALALARPVPQRVELRAECLTDRRRDGCQFLREFGERVAETVTEMRSRKQRPHALDGTVKAICEDAPHSIGRLLLERRALKHAIGLVKVAALASSV